MEFQTSVLIAESLKELASGNEQARNRLIELSSGRLQKIAHRMLIHDRVRQFEQTDDVVQEACIRIHRELERTCPNSTREFLNFSAFHIRRCLCEMARKHFRAGKTIALDDIRDRDTCTASEECDPELIALETEKRLEVLEKISYLPDNEREVTELIWIHGLNQEEVASIMGISTRSVRRYSRSARLMLAENLSEN